MKNRLETVKYCAQAFRSVVGEGIFPLPGTIAMVMDELREASNEDDREISPKVVNESYKRVLATFENFSQQSLNYRLHTVDDLLDGIARFAEDCGKDEQFDEARPFIIREISINNMDAAKMLVRQAFLNESEPQAVLKAEAVNNGGKPSLNIVN